MAEKQFTWGRNIQSNDTFSSYFEPPIDFVTYTSVGSTLRQAGVELINGINTREATDTGNYNMGADGYIAGRSIASTLTQAVVDKLRATLSSNNDNIDDYVIFTQANIIVQIWKRSYAQTYESLQLTVNPVRIIHRDDVKNFINNNSANYKLTSEATPSRYEFVYNKVTYGTYTHNYYFLSVSQLQITAAEVAGAYDKIYNALSVSKTIPGSQVIPTQILGGVYERGYNGTGSGGLYTSSVAIYFGSYGSSEKDLYNPEGKDDASSGKYPSTELGGQGTFDDSTDLSEISSIPDINISDLGFFSVWMPTTAQLKQLAKFVWNNPFNVSEWAQIFQSGIIKPMDYIISLQMLPIKITDVPLQVNTFCMGGMTFNGSIDVLGLNILMNKIQKQIIDVDMGTIDLLEYFGSFYDYAPHTKIQLYLPYYGVVELSANEVQNSKIHLVYRINVFDGSTTIKVHLTRLNKNNGSVDMKHVLYEYNTNVSMQIPLTAGQNTEQMKMIATVVAGAATAVAAPVAAGGASAIAGGLEGASQLGGIQGAMTGALGGASSSRGAALAGQTAKQTVSAVANAGKTMINSIPNGGGAQRSNNAGFNSGILSERRPWIMVSRPIQVVPENFGEQLGFPAFISKKLSECQGYTQVYSIHLQIPTATAQEIQEIESLLKGGVRINAR